MKNLKSIFNIVKEESTFIYWTTILSFLLAIGCGFGLILDERTLLGVNVWLKPFKFSISTGIYLITVGALTRLYPYSSKKRKFITWTVGFTMFLDLLIIIFQGSRGVQSHYNMSSPIDALLYLIMGIFVGINVLFMLLFIIDTIRLKMNTSKAIQWSVLIGWVVVLVGSYVGGQMIGQLAHNVGVADGGEGLPLVNWSKIGGDLRVAHFFGLHGIQIIPLFALWLSHKWETTDRNHILAVTTFGLIYAGWIAFTFYQAKLGMPLIAVN